MHAQCVSTYNTWVAWHERCGEAGDDNEADICKYNCYTSSQGHTRLKNKIQCVYTPGIKPVISYRTEYPTSGNMLMCFALQVLSTGVATGIGISLSKDTCQFSTTLPCTVYLYPLQTECEGIWWLYGHGLSSLTSGFKRSSQETLKRRNLSWSACMRTFKASTISCLLSILNADIAPVVLLWSRLEFPPKSFGFQCRKLNWEPGF